MPCWSQRIWKIDPAENRGRRCRGRPRREFLQPDASVRYLPQEPDLAGFADVYSFVVAGLGPNGDDYRAHYLLDALGLTGPETPETLSGGEARRAALARALAPEPDILVAR